MDTDDLHTGGYISKGESSAEMGDEQSRHESFMREALAMVGLLSKYENEVGLLKHQY
jgi:hypothetical protein